MNAIVNYFVEVNIALTLFYVVYYLLFRRETDFNARRKYLLVSLLCSTIFPLISIPVFNKSEPLFQPGWANSARIND